VSAQPAAVIPSADPARRREFVVDLSAKMLRRNKRLSKNARRLYGAMRALADGQTGELRIGKRWKRGEEIDAAAEMCREVRFAAMHELLDAGLVTREFEMVVRFIGGRRRAVRSRVQYTVYRTAQKPNVSGGANPEIVEKPCILLKSISSMVEKIDSQVLSRLPSTVPIPTAGFEFVGETVEEGSKSSLTHARKARDVQMTNPPLPFYENFKDQFPDVTSRQFAFAVERISSRAKTPPRSLQFWQTSLANFFAGLEAEADLFLTGHAVVLFQSGASDVDVVRSLKDEASERDLADHASLIDRIICQALGRLERERLLLSGLGRGAGPEVHQ